MLETEKLLTIEEVAEQLGVAVQTVFKYKRIGKLPYIKLGASLRFDPKDISDFIRFGRQQVSCPTCRKTENDKAS